MLITVEGGSTVPFIRDDFGVTMVMRQAEGSPDREILRPPILIESARHPEVPGGEWVATLLADQKDPFFFDHPLDHVPAMVLLAALTDLVRRAAGPALEPMAGRRLRCHLDFLEFCELGERTLLGATRDGTAAADPRSGAESARWTVRAHQEPGEVCDGRLSVVDGPLTAETVFGDDAPAPDAGQRAPARPAPAHLVHRSRPENIMAGEVLRSDDGSAVSLVLDPAPDHFLTLRGGAGRCVEELVEAARQFMTMLTHVEDGMPLGTQLIVKSLEFDLPVALSRDVPSVMRFRPSPRLGKRRYVYALELRGAAHGAGPLLGWVRFDLMAVTQSVYELIRASRQEAR